MSLSPIPLIKIQGTHFEAGYQLGQATAAYLRRPLEPAEGRTWEEMRHLARPYMEATQAVIPWLHAEMEGISAGSGVEVVDLYALATEEIWDSVVTGPEETSEVSKTSEVFLKTAERCSDF